MKRKLIILAVLASGMLMTTCIKEDPTPCPGPEPEPCEATPFTEGFRVNVVGKWRFYKTAWFNQSNIFQGYKDTNYLGVSYMMEVHENGMVDYYRNDSLYETRKIAVWYDVEGNPPLEPLGGVIGDMDCISENPEENSFSVVLTHQDTLRASYRPVVFRVEATGEFSGNSYYYRMP